MEEASILPYYLSGLIIRILKRALSIYIMVIKSISNSTDLVNYNRLFLFLHLFLEVLGSVLRALYLLRQMLYYLSHISYLQLSCR
jgi:hypothetical protein